MRLAAIVLMAGGIAGAWAGKTDATEGRRVTVCMNTAGDVQVQGAQALASRMFAGIGVGIDWRKSSSCPYSPDVIKVSLSDDTPKTVHPGALAYALPYEGTTIVVFHDRLREMLRFATMPEILAYVLVHEITHILQGVKRHSATGIMKSCWDPQDYFDLRQKGPCFSAWDVELIYRGVDARASRIADQEPVLVATR